MDTGTTKLAILIANVSNSIGLYEKYGDIAAHTKIKECQDMFTVVTNDCDGNVTNTIGDQIMCAFPTANDAANAAIKMHKTLNNSSIAMDEVADINLSIHVGFHYGQAIVQDGNDVFGVAVNIASQLADVAQHDKIITTQSTVDLLPPELQENSHFIESTFIKGEKEKIDMVEIIWLEVK